MSLTKKEQKRFEDMFWEICKTKCENNKGKLEKLADLLFELTGNVNLRMWLSRLKVV